MKRFLERTFLPLLLIILCPPFAMLIWYVNVALDGSFVFMFQEMTNDFSGLISAAWLDHFWGSKTSWSMIGIFAAIQLVLMKILPGKKYKGSVTPMGESPEYKNNGLLAYLISFFLFFSGALVFKWYSLSIVYNHFGDILASLNITALCFCLFLLIKAKLFPNSADHHSSGNLIFDYYWGRELHPRILGWDIKMFTNCRFGMIGWAIIVTSFACASLKLNPEANNYGVICSALLIDIYLLKFFIWEPGYMRSMDIGVDKAGFYICWGCLVWVPSVYTSPILFMTHHPTPFSFEICLVLFLLGVIAVFINFWADHQRQRVRETHGQYKIWGKAPILIRATYITGKSEQKNNLLLASGFWGISRHFHYLPEIVSAFIWSCMSGFYFIMPFFYVIFLTILLVHRSLRDEQKCSLKYGMYWEEYKKKVPYRIIPFIY